MIKVTNTTDNLENTEKHQGKKEKNFLIPLFRDNHYKHLRFLWNFLKILLKKKKSKVLGQKTRTKQQTKIMTLSFPFPDTSMVELF